MIEQAMGEPGRPLNIGVLGLGARGYEQLKLLCSMPDVHVTALCDPYTDRLDKGAQYVLDKRGSRPFASLRHQDVLDRPKIEAVVIMTDWQSHIPLAIAAMKAGKIPGLEVGGANSVEECWQLVRTSEETGIPVMLLENCCYGKEEMTLLNMVRLGIFGDIIHCRGGYEHDLRDEVGEGDLRRHYRLDHFMRRNGELYPTHELGPIAKYLKLNYGNRMQSLVAMATKAAGQHLWLKEHRPDSQLSRAPFCQGDVVTTMISCAGGQSILLSHDCSLPRPYSRGGRLQGTKGIWQEDNRGIFIEGRSPVDPDDWAHRWESDAPYMEEYCHPLWRAYEAYGLRGGHGGMDYLVLRAFIESIQQGQPFPIDVYDCASWMAITPLSEQSIALGSQPVAVPDFTGGAWIKRQPLHQGPYALG